MSENKRILSGMRPTNPRLHIGNYEGALRNWVDLQNQGYEMFCMVADWHALTTMFEETDQIGRNSIEITKDYISAAIAAADRFNVGHGHGPVHHFHKYY